jgi:hypothetical protein
MEPTTASLRERERRFREVYHSVYVDLLRFVRRRVERENPEVDGTWSYTVTLVDGTTRQVTR